MFFCLFFFAFFVLFFVVVVMIIIFSVLFIHLLYPQVITTQLWWRCYCTGLVLRPVYHPVFDHLQYAKTKGEGRLVSIYVSHEWRQCLPRWVHADGGRSSQPKECVTYVATVCAQDSTVGIDTPWKGYKMASLLRAPLPTSVCLIDIDVTCVMAAR